MKSTNNYKAILLVSVLLLSVFLLFAACDGAGAGGNGTDAPTGTGDPQVSDGVDATDGSSTGETDPIDPSDTDPASSGSAASGDDTGVLETPGSGNETAGGSVTPPESSEPSETTGAGGLPSIPAVTTAPSGSETTEPGTTVTYTVNVVDANGDPVKNIIVSMLGKDVVTNKNGVATYQLVPDNYTFTLKAISSAKEYVYDESLCVFSPSVTSVTVVFAEKLDQNLNTRTIYANDKEYLAAIVGEGTVQVSLAPNDMTYFLFSPTRSGVFRFSATSSKGAVDIGYYGGIHFVQSTKALEMIDDYFEISVRTSSIGVTFVIGLKMVNGSAGMASLKIERIGNVALDAADAPWTAVPADSKYLVKYSGVTDGKTLKDVDITDKNTKIVLNDADGYYHLGDKDGPVVMMRINSESPYIASFVDICSTSPLGVYYYDANGTFLYKEQYNDMIEAYAQFVDAKGTVPLNAQLIDMIQKVGTYKGWWKETSPQYIFETDMLGNPINEIESIAWMFACCYYE